MLVCGVCDRDVEHWMTLDPDYASRLLDFDVEELPARRDERSTFIKGRIGKIMPPADSFGDFVARYVTGAPAESFRRWLSNPAFGRFYDECRHAALSRNCAVTNER
jgi:hypothetical protein